MVLIWNLTGPVDKTARPSKRTLHVEAEGKAAAPHKPLEVRPLEVSHALGLGLQTLHLMIPPVTTIHLCLV